LYEGDYNDKGEKHGEGKITFEDGSFYDGDWESGVINGSG
jgi:hypothetical protein